VSAWGRTPLSLRIGLAAAATISAAIASYGFVTLRQQERLLVDIARRDTVAHAENVADATVHHLIVGDYAAVDHLLLRFARDPEVTAIAVTRPDGAPLSEVRRAGEGPPVVTAVPDRLPAPPQPGLSVSASPEEVVVWQPVTSTGHLGWVRLVTRLDEVRAAERAVKASTLALAVIWSVAATALLVLLLRRPLVSIRQVADFARELGKRRGATVHAASTAPEIVGLATALNDASRELEASEARLLAERQLLAATLRSIADGVVATDAGGKVVLANAAAEALAGCGPGQATGRRFGELFPAEAGPGAAGGDPVARVLSAGRPLHLGEQPAPPGRDGRPRTIALGGAPIVGAEGVGAVLVLRDVTAQHEAERQHRDLQRAFEQAQKLESVGRLAGGVAHDFNNVLTVILGNVELAMLSVGEDSPIVEPLREMREAAKGAAAVTRQLLAFSRKSVIEPQSIDLAEALERLGKMLRRLIGEDVALHVAPWRGTRAWVDPGQLEQVLVNLVVNARDAMPGGGEITIRVESDHLASGDPRLLPGMAPGEYAVLSVTDTGTGMTEEVKQHVFEPFFTTKEKGKGTGLGLATVYGAVRQNRGLVEIDSAPGKGSTFRIFLPSARAVAVNERREAGSVEPLRPGTETILLVEDEPAVRRLASRALEEAGYHVLSCADGAEALAVAGREKGPIHLVVSDVVMPGMDGPSVVGEISKLRPGARVLFVSGYLGNANDVLERLARKGAPVLAKPFTPAALSNAVRAALDAAA
jgi:PAS domain S-box-containing protein